MNSFSRNSYLYKSEIWVSKLSIALPAELPHLFKCGQDSNLRQIAYQTLEGGNSLADCLSFDYVCIIPHFILFVNTFSVLFLFFRKFISLSDRLKVYGSISIRRMKDNSRITNELLYGYFIFKLIPNL